MQFLPIVERELRVAARHPRTWWRRVLMLLAALAILGFVWLTFGRWATLSRIGAAVFQGLSGFGMAYALLAGPLATADCLSRERREGTLGLLFLTDLRSYDVVLGKISASSLDVLLGLLAATPVLAMPVLAGGVSLTQFAYVVLTLTDLMLFSLAIGVFASSLVASGRAAVGLTFGILLVLTFGLPLVGEAILHIRYGSPAAAFFYMFCPLWSMSLCLGQMVTFSSSRAYWLNMGGLHAISWVLVSFACWYTSRSWRDLPESARWRLWRDRFRRWGRGSSRVRLAWRRSLLKLNPAAWVEGRDQLQDRILMLLVCGSAIFLAIKHLESPQTWPGSDDFIVWAIFSHYILCLWIAIQAPRRFADDKQSGALELLLCTTLPARRIIRGIMFALWVRFGRPLLGMIVVDAFLVQAYVSNHGGWSNVDSNGNLLILCIGATVVFPLQGYAFARVGLYEALVKSSSLRATFALIWSLGFAPWVVFVAGLILCDFGRRIFGFFPRTTERIIFSWWITSHLLVLTALLAFASWQLHYHFRLLAAATPRSWWTRVLDRFRSHSPEPAAG